MGRGIYVIKRSCEDKRLCLRRASIAGGGGGAEKCSAGRRRGEVPAKVEVGPEMGSFRIERIVLQRVQKAERVLYRRAVYSRRRHFLRL